MAATWKAAQDINISLAPSTVARLRVLLNAVDDPATAAYQLEYKLSSDSVWLALVASNPVEALPTFVNKGTFQGSAAALTVPPPAGYQDDDIFLLFVESANQAIATPSGGWAEVTNSPQSTGTAATAGGVRLAVFWKLASGTQADVTVADTVNHQTAIMMAFRGVHLTTPIHLTAGAVDSSATASLSCPGLTTTITNCLIVNAIGLDKDLADVDTLSSLANAALGSVTERHDETITAGAGGGLAVITGTKAATGAIGNTTATGDTSTTHAYLTLALAPKTPLVHALLLATSTNIAASAATATTAQLTAPAGKSSGADFQAGKISDDTNPLPTIDLAADKYTELEWCLTTTATAVDTGVYHVRVTAAGTPLTSYGVTPQITIAAADVTGPTLSDQTVGTLTTVGGVPAVTTNENTGTAYLVIVPNGNSPSVAQIKAGQNSSGGAALAAANQAVSATGVQTFSAVTGLASNTPYDAWFAHTDAATNDSTAVKADFTTVFAFNDARQAIIDGLDSAQSEAAGWDALKASIPVSAVVRTSDTVVTITLPALPSYSITADETITATVPASAVVGNATIVATPTITVTNAAGVSGDLAQALGALTLVSAGTVDVAGQVAVTLGSLTLSATGTVDVQGTVTATLGTLTVASAGTVDIAGVLAQTLGVLTSDAQGVVGDAPIEGVLDQALGALTVVVTGTVDVLGVASPPLGALTVIAAGTVDVQGVLTQTLAPATLASAGQAEITATLAVTLADATVVSTGTVADGIPVLGDLTQALGTLTAVATGTVEVSGALTQDLGSLSLAGVATAEITGVAALTLGPLTSTATGTVDVVGALTQTLGVIQVQSDGVVGDPPIQGDLSQTLGVLTVVGTGQAEISAVATSTLGALTLVATLTTEIRGAAAPTLGALTSTGTGTVALSGQAAISLGDLVGALTGAVEVHGVLAVTLEALTVVPETLWQPVARPGTLYTTRLGGTRTGTRITASHTHTELTEAA